MTARVPFSEILGVLELHGWKLQRIASPYRIFTKGRELPILIPFMVRWWMRSMQKRSRKSSKRTSKATSKGSDRPFDTGILKRARKVVSAYRIILEKDAGLGYIGSSIEIPSVFADGATPASCVDAIQQALTFAVATMIECGRRPPAAASSGKRDVQINIRLTAQEKLRLSDAARRLGFKGVSDFVRLAALERTSAA